MPFDSAVDLVKHGPQAQIGLERAEHRLEVGQHRVGAPQRGVVQLHEGRAQAIHTRVHGSAAGLDALGPGDGTHLRAGVVFGDLDLIVLRRTRVALLGAPRPVSMSLSVAGSLALPANTRLRRGNPLPSSTIARVTSGQSLRHSLLCPRLAWLTPAATPSK